MGGFSHKISFFLYFFVVASALFAWAQEPQTEEPQIQEAVIYTSAEQCEADGGRWSPQGFACQFETNDGGKECVYGWECEGQVCFADKIVNGKQEDLRGFCTEWTNPERNRPELNLKVFPNEGTRSLKPDSVLTQDAGKECTDGSQCQGECLAVSTALPGKDNQQGHCSTWTKNTGAIVVNGRLMQGNKEAPVAFEVYGAKDPAAQIQYKTQEECEAAGGIWSFIYAGHHGMQLMCKFEAKDAGKLCTDDTQCESLQCLPYGTRGRKDDIARSFKGHCAQWPRDPRGCQSQMKNGVISSECKE